LGFRDQIGAEHGTAARAILDDDRLAELGREAVGEHARDEVKTAAGRLRHDDAQRAARKALRERGRGKERRDQEYQAQRHGGGSLRCIPIQPPSMTLPNVSTVRKALSPHGKPEPIASATSVLTVPTTAAQRSSVSFATRAQT